MLALQRKSNYSVLVSLVITCENVPILITSLGKTWENVPILITSLRITWEIVPILIKSLGIARNNLIGSYAVWRE